MRPLLDWLRNLAAGPDRPGPRSGTEGARAPSLRWKRVSVLECVTCRRRKHRGGAWTAADPAPRVSRPTYTVCSECAKRAPE